MDYGDLLKLIGVEVLDYRQFGSYEGRWFARCKQGDEIFFISDYFGSCSGCDALENIDDYHFAGKENEIHSGYNTFVKNTGCPECVKAVENFKKLANDYLENKLDKIGLMEKFEKSSAFSLEDKEALEYIKKNY